MPISSDFNPFRYHYYIGSLVLKILSWIKDLKITPLLHYCKDFYSVNALINVIYICLVRSELEQLSDARYITVTVNL